MLAIIGGSEAHKLLPELCPEAVRLGPVDTPFGRSQPVFQVTFGQAQALFLPRHGERGYELAAPFVNYRANIYALRELGARRIIAWSGPGAIAENLAVGQYVVPDDCLDETTARPRTFFEGTGLGFVRQNPVFCPELREALIAAARATGRPVAERATYACTEGPRLETPAEVRKLKLLGADVVGMTLAPELFLARELAMCYAMVCYISNFAEGLRPRPYRAGELFEGLLEQGEAKAVRAAVAGLAEIVSAVAREVYGKQPRCPCPHSMDRYIREGRVSEDWHTWVAPWH